MATPWVLRIGDEDADTAAWAAQEAFTLIDRLEEDLSRFQPVSYVSQLGRLRKNESLRVSPETYECLLLAKAVWQETKGAFDVTVVTPETELGETGRWSTQMDAFTLCQDSVVEVNRDRVRIDLGGLGKGFAIDEITQFFKDQEIACAFLDAGGSTLFALGSMPGETDGGWPASLGRHGMIALEDGALSASGFEVKGQHVMDPRTGQPVVTDRQRAWVLAGSAAIADALSTAALIMTEDEIADFCETHPDVSIMLA